MANWEMLAASAAAAQGATFLVGVRAHNGSWFAHCNGMEVDGSSASGAARALVKYMAKQAHEVAWKASKEAQAAERRAADLAGLDA